MKNILVLSLSDNPPEGGWAGPGSTAIPGQPLAGAMQATHTRPVPKISLIFWGPFDPVSDIKLIRTDLKHCIFHQGRTIYVHNYKRKIFEEF